MKPRFFSQRFLLAVTSTLCLFSSHQTHAATRYWDGASTSGDADGGVGTWNTATNWDTAATGGTDVAWNNTTPDSAVFVGAAGTVTLGAARTAAGLTFNTGGTVISAISSRVLTIGAGGITVGASAGSGNQIGAASSSNGYVTLIATQEWTNNSAHIFFARDGDVALGSNTLTLSGSGQINLASTTTGSGNIVVSSGATASMSGNNSYSGTTTIYGTLTINSLTNYSAASGLGDKASNAPGNLVIDGGTLRVQVENGTSDRLFTMGANGASLEARLTGANSGRIQLTNTAAIAYSGVGDRSLALGGNSDDTSSSIALAIGDVGAGSGIVSVVKNEAHNWTVSGTNTYSGGTTVNQGTLTMGSASALGSTSGQLTVHGGTLDLAGNSLTVGNFTGTGGVISGTSGTRTLTIGQGDGTGGNYHGQINNGTGGTTALTKVGTGTITLSGTNGYTGATTVGGGTLVVNGSIANTATTVETTGVITGTGNLGSSVNVKSTGVVNAGAVGTINATATVTGATNFESGAIFSWDLSANGASGDKLTTSSVSGSGAIFRILLADGTANNSFFDTTHTDFFAESDIISSVTDLTSLFGSVQVYSGLTNLAVDVSSRGAFSLTSNGLTWTAVPEPGTALGGLLLTAGLFRRRRQG